MPKFYTLKVKEIRQETPDCVSVSFEVPEKLREEYQFFAGQHLNLKTQLNGEEIRRSYSICSSPEEQDLRVGIKKLPNGIFSTYAHTHLLPGDEIDVMTPLGNFYTPLDPKHRKHYVAFAAGSGITPVISIMKAVLSTEPQSHFTLFYGNRRAESIIFREQIEDLKNKHLQHLSVHHVLSQEDPGAEWFHGRIDAEKCGFYFTHLLDPQGVDEVFICGPQPMIESLRDCLPGLGISREKIHSELFTSALSQPIAAEKKWTPPAQPVLAQVTITLDGKTFTFNHTSSGVPILDAALKAGADLPFSCKGGVCCTCKAKLLEGEVDMEVNYGLEQEEVDKGYVLTCQSHPRTGKIVLSFDD